MPSFCAVINCNDRYGHSENISFHKFPIKRLDLLKQWEAFIQKQRGEDWHASRWTSLCSRHFRDEDFRSLNERKTLKKTAVPTILCEEVIDRGDTAEEKIARKKPLKIVETLENTRDKEFKEILAIKERLEDVGGNGAGGSAVATVPKTNCRLCGISSVPVATFLTNYELYGLLQKCFPTLNIQQEDALPKVLCEVCYKNLEEFGKFVDRVWTAQTELQRKFRSRVVEKPVKIKQEPLVRVKQEVAESGYDDHQDTQGGGANDDYDGAMDGGVHEEGDDQKYEFCDFPIINDCDIMEIINLDDPFINIPDDDNTTTVNEEEENLQKPMQDPVMHYLTTAHELLQSHLLMEEHNYAYIDAEDFKEERQIYKTEKSDNDERLLDYNTMTIPANQQSQPLSHRTEHHPFNYPNYTENSEFVETPTSSFENRALKPIVTSVSAIQQPTTKSSSNGIVVLNESIVKSGCGFQLHACMVCQLKFFSVESLKQHYTQTHGTPMVTVPTGNITMEKVAERSCKMEKEFSEPNLENSKNHNSTTIENDLQKELQEATEDLTETKKETPENYVDHHQHQEKEETPNVSASKNSIISSQPKEPESLQKDIVKKFTKRNSKKLKMPLKSRKSQIVSLDTMANQYQQLKKLYQKLQKKCTNLEQNVEQLQLLPPPTSRKKTKVCKNQLNKPKNLLPNTINTTLKNLSITQISTAISSKKKMPLNKSPKPSIISSSASSFTCTVCSKSFSNSNSLRQHKITHTEERKHICSLCQRSFKRRNGLLQHLKGFHLQVKPFACPVCKHCYALKCDMLRCKHSILKGLHNSSDKLNVKDRLVLKNLDK